jgi:hypothetical protein
VVSVVRIGRRIEWAGVGQHRRSHFCVPAR